MIDETKPRGSLKERAYLYVEIEDPARQKLWESDNTGVEIAIAKELGIHPDDVRIRSIDSQTALNVETMSPELAEIEHRLSKLKVKLTPKTTIDIESEDVKSQTASVEEPPTICSDCKHHHCYTSMDGLECSCDLNSLIFIKDSSTSVPKDCPLILKNKSQSTNNTSADEYHYTSWAFNQWIQHKEAIEGVPPFKRCMGCNILESGAQHTKTGAEIEIKCQCGDTKHLDHGDLCGEIEQWMKSHIEQNVINGHNHFTVGIFNKRPIQPLEQSSKRAERYRAFHGTDPPNNDQHLLTQPSEKHSPYCFCPDCKPGSLHPIRQHSLAASHGWNDGEEADKAAASGRVCVICGGSIHFSSYGYVHEKCMQQQPTAPASRYDPEAVARLAYTWKKLHPDATDSQIFHAAYLAGRQSAFYDPEKASDSHPTPPAEAVKPHCPGCGLKTMKQVWYCTECDEIEPAPAR